MKETISINHKGNHSIATSNPKTTNPTIISGIIECVLPLAIIVKGKTTMSNRITEHSNCEENKSMFVDSATLYGISVMFNCV